MHAQKSITNHRAFYGLTPLRLQLQSLSYDLVLRVCTAESISHFNFRTEEMGGDVGDDVAEEERLPLDVGLETGVRGLRKQPE